MNSSFRKYGYLMAVAVLVSASASFAQTTQINLTGVGDGNVVWNAGSGVYVDPYTATVGGVANTSVICDDWSDNSYVGESWTANVTKVSSLGTSTTPMFSGATQINTPNTPDTLTQAQLYDEAAWLGTQLLANPSNYANQVAVSFALWELTYNATGSAMETPTPYNFLAGSAEAGQQSCSGQTCIATLLAEAQTAVAAGYNGQGWSILTPNTSDPITCNGGACPDSPPQEFLVYTPESSSVVLLGADMLGLLALAFVFRKRLLLPVS